MTARFIGRILLGTSLIFAGIAHLTFARAQFQAQVPEFVPLAPDTTVLASGATEIGLGSALLLTRKKRGIVGSITACFFVAVFQGNVSQWIHQRDAFGLDTDNKRFVRLFFQPALVWWALWSTR